MRRVSSSRRGQSTCSPAHSASSTRAVPGTSVEPRTTWSASQGWVAVERWPVSTAPSPSASETTAPSRGCPALPRPAAARFLTAAGAGQYRSRWKGYVGSSTGAPPQPSKSAAQSGSAPAACRVATARSSCPASSRPAREAATRQAGSEPSGRQFSAMAVRTPSGPTSRKRVTPWAWRVVIPSAKRTASRTWRTQ